MANAEQPLPDDTLEQLATVLDDVEQGTSLMASSVALAKLGLPGRVTVDFRARASLGHPLVVFEPRPEPPAWWPTLTPREQQVAVAIAEGRSNRIIAERLGIRVSTVKDHVHHILKKSRFRRRTQVAAAVADFR